MGAHKGTEEEPVTNPAMKYPTLSELVTCLATARQAERITKGEIADLEAEIAATPAGQRLARERRALADARFDVQDLEDQVREAALNEHRKTGDKRPHAATTIKAFVVLSYPYDQALTYCREHLPQAVVTTLDHKTFEAVVTGLVKAGSGLDFVTIGQDPRATIARDLGAYLPREEE